MIIDKTLFVKTESVRAVILQAKSVGFVLRHPDASRFVWSRPGRKSVYPDPADPAKSRILLVNNDLPSDIKDEIPTGETTFAIRTSYDDFDTEEALRILIPDTPERPTSFETVGHIAHMNLRDEFLPFKEVIGQVIIDKNKHINVVVTKVGTLSNEFRTFNMEIIGARTADRSLVATVSENKMRLTVDYQKCYWNSRLSFERERLLQKFLFYDTESTRLVDMCCGIGALACFAAREGMEVFANDLNPDAIACAKKNAIANKVNPEFHNIDAREFVRSLVKDGKLGESKTNHVMINLPEIGIEFLDVFNGLFESEHQLGANEFRIYCHCFSKDNSADISERVNRAMRAGPDGISDIKAVHVRDVAPNKIMYSAEFVVPRHILISAKKFRL